MELKYYRKNVLRKAGSMNKNSSVFPCHLEQAGLFTAVPVSAGNVQNTQNPKSLKEQTAKIHQYGQSFRIKRGIYVSIR